MPGYTPIPNDAIALCGPEDMAALVDLYSRANALRYRPLRTSERSMCRKWQMGNRRCWSLLDDLRDAGLLEYERGKGRQPTVISVFKPAELTLNPPISPKARQSGQRVGQRVGLQNGVDSTDDIDEPAAVTAAVTAAVPNSTLSKNKTKNKTKNNEAKTSTSPKGSSHPAGLVQWFPVAADRWRQFRKKGQGLTRPIEIELVSRPKKGSNSDGLKRLLGKGTQEEATNVSLVFDYLLKSDDFTAVKYREDRRTLWTVWTNFGSLLGKAENWAESGAGKGMTDEERSASYRIWICPDTGRKVMLYQGEYQYSNGQPAHDFDKAAAEAAAVASL